MSALEKRSRESAEHTVAFEVIRTSSVCHQKNRWGLKRTGKWETLLLSLIFSPFPLELVCVIFPHANNFSFNWHNTFFRLVLFLSDSLVCDYIIAEIDFDYIIVARGELKRVPGRKIGFPIKKSQLYTILSAERQ